MSNARMPKPADLAPDHGFSWNLDDVHAVLVDGLQARADAADQEQAVQGIDALSEIALHALLGDVLAKTPMGVLRERVYPGQPSVDAPKARAKDSARMRCDLVLTPRKSMKLLDPIEELRARDALEGTLFADTPFTSSTKESLPPAHAMWMEVKTVGQHCFRRGVPVPNTSYATELTQSMFEDLAKLSHEPLIHHGVLTLVLFTANQETAEHDIGIAMHRVLDRGVAFRSPLTGGFPITDRIGNAWCCVTIIPSTQV